MASGRVLTSLRFIFIADLVILGKATFRNVPLGEEND